MFIGDCKFVGPEVRDMLVAYHLISFYDFICHMVDVKQLHCEEPISDTREAVGSNLT